MANLYLAYAITPVTQDHIASLEKVLLGVVSEPVSEVPRSVSIDALNFLQDVLSASHTTSAGVSATGADYVADILTLLLATGFISEPLDRRLSAAADQPMSVARTLEVDSCDIAAANQFISVVSNLGAAQLKNGVVDIGKITTSGDLDMHSLRTRAITIFLGLGGVDATGARAEEAALATIPLSPGMSGTSFSAAAVSVSQIASVLGLLDSPPANFDVNKLLIDVRLAELGTNPYECALADIDGAGGTLDVDGVSSGTPLTLRSKLTMVEMALSGSLRNAKTFTRCRLRPSRPAGDLPDSHNSFQHDVRCIR